MRREGEREGGASLQRKLLLLLTVVVIGGSLQLLTMFSTADQKRGMASKGGAGHYSNKKPHNNEGLLLASRNALQTLGGRNGGRVVIREDDDDARASAPEDERRVDAALVTAELQRAEEALVKADAFWEEHGGAGRAKGASDEEDRDEDWEVRGGTDGPREGHETAEEWCTRTKRTAEVEPGQSWGTLSGSSIEEWKERRCDRFFCKPNPMEAVGSYRCEPLDA